MIYTVIFLGILNFLFSSQRIEVRNRCKVKGKKYALQEKKRMSKKKHSFFGQTSRRC